MEIDQIINGCIKGKRDAQEALVHKFGPALLAVCNRYCNDSNLAYDALQECFINAFKYIGTYQNKGSFEGWMRKIAVRSSIKLIKKFKPLMLVEEDVILESAIDYNIPDAYSRIGIDEINYFLQKLSPSLKIVFNLNVVEGYSHKEISRMLGIGESTSRSNLTKARAKLILMLTEEKKTNLKGVYLKNSKIAI